MSTHADLSVLLVDDEQLSLELLQAIVEGIDVFSVKRLAATAGRRSRRSKHIGSTLP